jgi:hypothetical protein
MEMILPDAVVAASRFLMMAMLSYTKLGNPLPVFAPVHPIIIALTPKHPHPTTTIAHPISKMN